jgi:glycosyltransferase involved in cell wall biosynthesis
VVHNAIDVASFPFSNDKDDYLLFLSRIAPEKGTHLAIEAARRLGMPLIVAGKVDRVDRAYFHEVVEPLIDGEQVVFHGEADAACKRELFRRAYCLVIPLRWDEPFGLVLAEAMACGTPVVAFRRGAAPEVVAHGETGFLVDDLDELVGAVRRVDAIDPARCRRHVEEHFSPELAGQRYLAIYRSILEQQGRRPLFAVPALPAAERPAPAAT